MGTEEFPTATRSAILSRLYAALARELVHSHPNDGQEDRLTTATAAADQAIQLAAKAQDPHANASALLARHDVSWRPGTAAQRLPIIAELITAAEAAHDADLTTEGTLLRTATLIELGEPEGIHQLRRFVELSEHLGHARGQWAALSRRATLSVITGDIDRAAELATDALALGTEIGIPDCVGCHGTTLLSLAILGHSIEPMMPPENDPIAPVTPIVTALTTPDVDHRSAVRNVPLSALAGYHDLEFRIAAAAAFAAYGTDSQRRIEYETLAPYAGTHVVVGGCATHLGTVDHYLGSLAAALGDYTRAAQHFQDAIEACRKLGAPGWKTWPAPPWPGSRLQIPLHASDEKAQPGGWRTPGSRCTCRMPKGCATSRPCW